MTLWFVFALMTAAAIFAVLLPLGLRGAAQTEGSEANGTAHVTLTALGGRMDYAWTDFKRVEGWSALSPTR